MLQQLLDLNKNALISIVLFAVLPSSSATGTQQIRSSFGPTVDLTHCIYREEFTEPASSYIIRSRSTGSRTIVNYNTLPGMTSDEFITMADNLDVAASWYHFEARLILYIAKETTADEFQGRIPKVTLAHMWNLRRSFPAVKISVEVEKPSRVGLQELAAEADVVFYSKSWAQVNSPHFTINLTASTKTVCATG